MIIRILIGAGLLLLIAVAGVVTLYVLAAGDYVVLPTVVDDPSLPRVELNGYTFHAETHGNPEAPTIVVLHGGPGGDYRSLLALAELGDTHHVVFYDQRGAGLSERAPATELTATSGREDLDAFIDHYSPNQPVTLIGHSWGATLAAGYLRHHPDKVASAVLAEPGYLDPAEFDTWKQRYDELMSGWAYTRLAITARFEAQHVNGPDPDASGDYLVGQRILPAFTHHPDNPYHCPGHAYEAPSWRWGKTASDALAGETFQPLDSTAHAYDGPVLFLAGACNTWIGETLQAQHAQDYPGAQLAVIADAGHDMFWENPGDTISTIRNFLATHHHSAPRPTRWSPAEPT